jgi:hypothetical protein
LVISNSTARTGVSLPDKSYLAKGVIDGGMLMGGEKLFEIGLADEEIRIFFDVSAGNNQFFTGGKPGGVFAELFGQLSPGFIGEL